MRRVCWCRAEHARLGEAFRPRTGYACGGAKRSRACSALPKHTRGPGLRPMRICRAERSRLADFASEQLQARAPSGHRRRNAARSAGVEPSMLGSARRFDLAADTRAAGRSAAEHARRYARQKKRGSFREPRKCCPEALEKIRKPSTIRPRLPPARRAHRGCRRKRCRGSTAPARSWPQGAVRQSARSAGSATHRSCRW